MTQIRMLNHRTSIFLVVLLQSYLYQLQAIALPPISYVSNLLLSYSITDPTGYAIYGYNTTIKNYTQLSISGTGSSCPRYNVSCASCSATIVGWSDCLHGPYWCSDGTLTGTGVGSCSSPTEATTDHYYFDYANIPGNKVPLIFFYDPNGKETLWYIKNSTNITVHLFGAGGGGSKNGGTGGSGAYVTGILSVPANETLRIIVGAGGKYNVQVAQSMLDGNGGAGGIAGGQGGGRSAIQRLINGVWTDVVTAGGGGGGGACASNGGSATWYGPSGNGSSPGIYSSECWMFNPSSLGGMGGTQWNGGTSGYPTTANGLFGYTYSIGFNYSSAAGSKYIGGNADPFNTGGGGGGGYYGGGSAVNAGGGAGSSFINNLLLANGTNGTGTIAPSVDLSAKVPGYNQFSSLIAFGGALTANGGNGLVILDYARPSPTPLPGSTGVNMACTVNIAVNPPSCSSPTPSSTSTASLTRTPSPSPTVTGTPTPTGTPSTTVTPTPTGTPTGTSTVTPSNTGTPSPSTTSTFSFGSTPSNTRTPSTTNTGTSSSTESSTATSTATATSSSTRSSTATKSSVPTVSSTATSTSTRSAVPTETSTKTSTSSGSASATNTATLTGTPTPSQTPSPSGTPTSSPSKVPPSATSTPTPTISDSPSNSPTPSITPTVSDSSTNTATGSATGTSTASSTATESSTATSSASSTSTSSASASATSSSSSSASATASTSATSSASSTATGTATTTATPTQTPTQTPTSTGTGTPTPSTTGSDFPTRPILAIGFEIYHVSSVTSFYLPATREVIRVAIAHTSGASAPDNVTLLQVKDATTLHNRLTIYDAPRNLQTAAVAVRVVVTDDDAGVRASSLLKNITELETVISSNLRTLGPTVFGACAVTVKDLLVPPVVPRYPPTQVITNDTFLGLATFIWIIIGAGAGVLLIVASIIICICARRKAFAAAAAAAAAVQAQEKLKPSRGKFRRMNSLLRGMPADGARVNIEHTHQSSVVVEPEIEPEEEETKPVKKPIKSPKPKPVVKDDDEEDDDKDPVLVENPLRKPARPQFSVDHNGLEEPKLPMDPPRPIERVTFDFPVSATTNPYHLMFLGDPDAKTAISSAITRAEALTNKLNETIAKIVEEIDHRRTNLEKSGIPKSTPTARLMDVVDKLEETMSSHGMRHAEVAAIRGGEEDKVLLELRRAKYVELAADLRRLLNLLEKNKTSAASREARTGKKNLFGLTSFAPTTRVALDNEAAMAKAVKDHEEGQSHTVIPMIMQSLFHSHSSHHATPPSSTTENNTESTPNVAIPINDNPMLKGTNANVNNTTSTNPSISSTPSTSNTPNLTAYKTTSATGTAAPMKVTGRGAVGRGKK